MLTAKISTKGQIVLPQKLRERNHVRPGDTFEFLDSDDPDVIMMRRLAPQSTRGLVDALLGCPHRFEIPRQRRAYPKKIEL